MGIPGNPKETKELAMTFDSAFVWHLFRPPACLLARGRILAEVVLGLVLPNWQTSHADEPGFLSGWIRGIEQA